MLMQPVLTDAVTMASGSRSAGGVPTPPSYWGLLFADTRATVLGQWRPFFSSSFPVGSATGKQKKPRHEVITCLRRESEKESHGSIVFALLRIIFSLQFPLLIANFSSFSQSHSTSAWSPSPTRAGASRNCHRWTREKHTCLFLIYLESSFCLVLLGRAAARLFWPRGWGLSPEDWPCRGRWRSQSKSLHHF